jgi:hypothetical protein
VGFAAAIAAGVARVLEHFVDRGIHYFRLQLTSVQIAVFFRIGAVILGHDIYSFAISSTGHRGFFIIAKRGAGRSRSPFFSLFSTVELQGRMVKEMQKITP